VDVIYYVTICCDKLQYIARNKTLVSSLRHRLEILKEIPKTLKQLNFSDRSNFGHEKKGDVFT